MKKVLFATTALVLTAGTAMAEVKFSGSGRVGLVYIEDRGTDLNDTQVDVRLRFNIDASKETDSGVTFGGRVRMQYDEGNTGARLSAAYVYAEANGFHVEVGNSNTAYDSVALMYNSEVGYISSSSGNPLGAYFGFSSGPYGAGFENYMGIFASYSVGDLNARMSYIQPDQTGATPSTVFGFEDEFSLSFDYKVGQFTVAIAAAQNGGGIDNNDLLFLGAEYAINDSTNVGLLLNDNGEIAGAEVGNSITLYGNTKLASGIGLKGYITKFDNDVVEDDVAIGLGADYDLGGATLAGSIQSTFAGTTYADIGVNFSF